MKRLIALLTIVAVALFAVLVMSTPAALAQPQSLLTHHVQPVVLTVRRPFVGKLPANQSMRIDIVLAVRDQPGSIVFCRTFTILRVLLSPVPHRRTVHREVRPEPARLSRAAAFCEGQRPDHDWRRTRRHGRAIQGFGSGHRDGLPRKHGRLSRRQRESRFYAPDREPTVDLPFQLWHITGLDNYSIPRPLVSRRPPGMTPPATTGSCPSSSFCGSDMEPLITEGTAYWQRTEHWTARIPWIRYRRREHLLQERRTKADGAGERHFTDGCPSLPRFAKLRRYGTDPRYYTGARDGAKRDGRLPVRQQQQRYRHAE